MRGAFKSTLCCLGLIAASLGFGVCDPVGEEPQAVSLPVLATSHGLTTCANDLGWTVTLTSFRVAIENVELTIGGETHASTSQRLRSLIVPPAVAHPGHYAGGEVTGELPGAFVLDLVDGDGQRLGEASLLPGDYNGVNFRFRATTEQDGLGTGDPLLGHSGLLAGTAMRNDIAIEFSAVLDVPPDTQMVGGPFFLEVSQATAVSLGLTAFTVDPAESDTLFDGLDFGALDDDGDGRVQIEPGCAAHNLLMKTLIRHDHWGIHIL